MTIPNRVRLVRCSLAFVPLMWAVACGDDDTSPGHEDAGSTGGKGAGGASTGGRSAGTGGARVGTGGVDAAAPPACDQSACEGKTVQGTPAPPCCIDADTCGVGAPGFCLSLELLDAGAGVVPDASIPEPENIVIDPSCPESKIALASYVVVLKGCCDPSGVCGVALAETGPFAQCLTPDDARAAGQPTTVESQRCGTGDAGRADAAASDSGVPHPHDAGADADATASGQ
jgi:hypothetical protein